MRKSCFFVILALQLMLTIQVKGVTVVGIHGFLTTSRTMRTIEKALQFCNFDVYLWDYPSRRRTLEEHAYNLIPVLQRISYQYPGEPIHFVSHSTGALVLRVALNREDCPYEAKIGRAVLLAPPNQGSQLARRFGNIFPISLAMGNQSGWELKNYEPNRIACFGNFPPSMEVLVIAGSKGNTLFFSAPNDGFLTIDETRLNTPYYFKCYPLTHGDLLTAPEALSCMRNFICGNCQVIELQE